MKRVLAFFALAACAAGASAQTWPTKPIRWVLPVGAGTSPDVIGRQVAEELGKKLGQTVLIENITGGQGLIAAQTVARAAPDGYTYFYGGIGLASDPLLFRDPGYSPEKDLTPVAMIYETGTFTIAVHPDTKVNSVPELIAMAKANPGKLNYGFFALGGPAMWGPWFTHVAGIDMQGIPYKGPGPLIQDAVAGRLNLMLGSYTSVQSMVKTGKLKLIGISAKQRVPNLPDVPAIAETLPGFTIGGTGVLVAPTGTPDAIVRRMNREIDPIVRDPAYVKKLNDGGTTVNGAGTPESISAYLKDLRVLYARMVKELNVQPE
jgi:tripartite-type tricarboxylate transporter receptor subunit TctC